MLGSSSVVESLPETIVSMLSYAARGVVLSKGGVGAQILKGP